MPEETETTIVIIAAQLGTHWVVFNEGADISEVDDSALTEWIFKAKPSNALTQLRASDMVTGFNLTRDGYGQYDPTAYAIAYSLSYCAVHLTGWTKVGLVAVESVSKPTQEDIQSLPSSIRNEFVKRSNPIINAVDAYAQLKKRKPEGNPEK